jgi:hypothetical protein
MLKNLTYIVLLLTIVSCKSPKTFYDYHKDYDKAYEAYLDGNTQIQKEVLLESFRDANEDRDIKVPPGSYLEYAYIVLREGKRELANQYFEKEIQLYPESYALIQSLKDNYENP